MNSADAFTVRLLENSGIGEGHVVLDVGCGNGAVTRMILDRVGSSGAVIGVDQDEGALALARARFKQAANVRFVRAALDELPAGIAPVDAIVCRRVLMYHSDVLSALRKLRPMLKPGGRIAIQEHDATAMPILGATLPLHAHIHHLIFETLRREGADVAIGFKLSAALESASFILDDLQVQATVLSAAAAHPIESIVRAMLPRMRAAGVLVEGELKVEELDQRLARERSAAQGTVLWELVFGARAHGEAERA